MTRETVGGGRRGKQVEKRRVEERREKMKVRKMREMNLEINCEEGRRKGNRRWENIEEERGKYSIKKGQGGKEREDV